MAKSLKAEPYIKLEQIARDIELNNPNWDILDSSFSKDKNLFDYQMEAIGNSIKILWKYFEEFNEDKEKFARLYEDLDIYKSLDISLGKNKFTDLLREFFNVNEGRIPFSEIANRMSFWMATGSGKTVVIVKLIEVLHRLMDMGLIPKREILFLTYREDLIRAFKKHLKKFNQGKDIKSQIKAISLKDYEREMAVGDLSNRVFIYRSDLISDERKENILNFRDYLSIDKDKVTGNWYLILDEAHKGDTQDSKRQNIFSILSQKGFLFNFSATFTEAIDIVTTVYNLNLNEFINRGYGKQIYLSQEEVKAFREKSDFNEREKRKIILKNLINLVAVKRAYENIKSENLYHNPLLIFLVNKINTKDADLKLVFKEIGAIAGNVDKNIFLEAKEELINELKSARYTVGNNGYTLEFIEKFLKGIDIGDIYRYVFNSKGGGNIEYIINPHEKREIALKLDTSDKPFALIKIGDISKWIKENLMDYKENEGFRNEGYFSSLNSLDSPINILLGSRAFYEGWDSNRPNIITFVNIGTGVEAKKFVLQAIGRGIRIEPLPNKRKRLDKLAINQPKLEELVNRYKWEIKTLETLFIYATNRRAIETILKELELVKKSEGFEEVSLFENLNVKNHQLLIPLYQNVKDRIINQKYPIRFRMSKENLELLKLYFQFVPKERFLAEYNVDINTYKELVKIINNNKRFIHLDESKNYKDVTVLINSLISYLNVESKSLKTFSPVENKIVHFRKIKVRKDYKDKFLKIIESVKVAQSLSDEEKLMKLQELIGKGKSFDEAMNDIQNTYLSEKEIEGVFVKKFLQHYYIPILYTNTKRDWIKHIIDIESEFDFITNLSNISKDLDRAFDWWAFSKLDEYLDKEIYIPYVSQGKLKKFIPDFIFWFKKGNIYKIIFIDPKGGGYSSYLDKIDGYISIFEKNGKAKIFTINDLEVSVELKLYSTDDLSQIHGNEYKRFWIDKNSLKEGVFI